MPCTAVNSKHDVGTMLHGIETCDGATLPSNFNTQTNYYYEHIIKASTSTRKVYTYSEVKYLTLILATCIFSRRRDGLLIREGHRREAVKLALHQEIVDGFKIKAR